MPLAFRPRIQHRLARAAGPRWVLLPHAYAFVDPLFSTGIAWSLRAVERLAQAFEQGPPMTGRLHRYEQLLRAEADQTDRLVAGAYEAMAHFDLFNAHAMLYFATVSFAETRERLVPRDSGAVAWDGFLGVGDPALHPLPHEGYNRLRRITHGRGERGTAGQRRGFADWVARAIAPRNIGGFADPARHHLYPVDLDVLVERHALLGLSRDRLLAALPALRGTAAQGTPVTGPLPTGGSPPSGTTRR
jgi:FADH2 O2-dependent halogenase